MSGPVKSGSALRKPPRFARSLTRVVFSLLLLILLSLGCASIPEWQLSSQWLELLPEQSQLYLLLDVAQNRAVLDELFLTDAASRAVLEDLLSRTRKLYVALDFRNGEVYYTLLGQGSYGKKSWELGLGLGKEWEKKPGFYAVWYNKQRNLFLSLPRNYLFFLSNQGLAGALDNFADPPAYRFSPQVTEAINNSDNILYLRDLKQALIAGFQLDLEKYPLKQAWLTFVPKNGIYQITTTVVLTSREKADKFSKAYRLPLVGWMRKEKVGNLKTIKQDVSTEVEGSQVRIGGIKLTQAELLRLLHGVRLDKGQTGYQ